MNFEELFRDFWWLMFPIFGMAMAFTGMSQSERRAKTMIDLLKTYTDQGKEPPPELLRMAAQSLDDGVNTPATRQQSNAWSFVVFAALSAGFTVGWWFIRDEGYAFAFLIVAVTMGVLAVGALLILLLGGKK
jgi:Flp pilus assembly protein TadB